MAISHVLSATTPDDPNYEIRPSHWNSAHAQLLTISGNTAGQSTFSGTNLVFSGGPNATLSINGNTLVFSGGAGAAGNTGYIEVGGGATASLGTVVFSNANGVSFGLDAQTLTASHNGLTSQSNQAVSAANGSYAFQTLSFSNANGVSFGTSAGSAITGSVAAQTNQTVGLYAVGNTTQNSSSTLDARTLSYGGRGIVSVGYSNGSIQVSATQSNQAFSAQGGSSAFQTLSFNNANGLTFSNNGGAVEASYTVPTVPAQLSVGNSNLGNTAGDTGVFTGRVVFVGSDNITLSGSSNGGSATLSIIGAAGGGGGLTNIRISAGATSNLLSAVTFADANGISFGIDASTITASHNGLTSQSNQNVTAANGGFAFQTLSFSNVNGISFGTSAGSAITASHNALTSQSNQAASASNGSFAFQTIAFSNANNVTFGTSAGSIITASVAAPGAAAENNWHNLLGANTAGNTTASGSTIGLSGINITLSGTNDSIVNISAPATSSLVGTSGISISTNGSTISIMQRVLSGYSPYDEGVQVAGQQGQATLHLQPMQAPLFQHDRLGLSVILSNSSNSTGSATISMWAGMYTQNGSTLSLAQSTSTTHGITFSGTVGNFSLQHGPRLMTIPWTSTWQEGNYWLGVVSRTTSGGTNASFSQLLVSDVNSNFSGIFGAASNATNQRRLGLGVYSASTSGIPNSIAFSQIQGTASNALRQPVVIFGSGTA